MAKINSTIFYPILSGLLLGLAFIFPLLKPLVLIGLVPLIFLIQKADKKNLFLIGFTTGIIYFLFVLAFLWGVHPLTALGINNNLVSFAIVLGVFFVSTLDMAIFWGAFTLLSSLINRSKILFLLGASAIFTIIEFFRSIGFGFLWAGSETLVGPHWTLGNLAYLLSDNDLFLYLSSFVGIYGLTFIIVAINISIYYLVSSSKKNKFIIATIILTVITFAPPLLSKNSQEDEGSLKVALIQTKNLTGGDYTVNGELEKFNKQLKLIKELSNPVGDEGVDLVVFPETSSFFAQIPKFASTPAVYGFFNKLFEEPTIIIDSSRIIENGKFKSRSIYLDTKEGILGYYDKQLLAPGGEFLPYSIEWLANVFSPSTAQFFNQARFYEKGEKLSFPIDVKKGELAALVCADLFSPNLSRSSVNLGSQLIVIQGSTGIFKGNRLIVNHYMDVAKLRAAENRRPLILATNYGYSYSINNNGKIIDITETYEPQILRTSVNFSNEKSIYTSLGDSPILIISIILLSFSIIKRSRT